MGALEQTRGSGALVGETYGRWTVLRGAAPAMRGTRRRRRVLARCVCGIEQIVWVVDLRSGRSKGCRSKICHHRWEATAHVRAILDDALEAAATRVLARLLP